MMASNRFVFCAVVVVVLIVLQIQTVLAYGLYCYTCTATMGSFFRCENLSYYGNTLPYNECFYSDAVCAKYVINYGDSYMIHRSCHHYDVCSQLAAKYNTLYSNLIECHTCNDQNYCNSAPNRQIGAATLVISVIFACCIPFFS